MNNIPFFNPAFFTHGGTAAAGNTASNTAAAIAPPPPPAANPANPTTSAPTVNTAGPGTFAAVAAPPITSTAPIAANPATATAALAAIPTIAATPPNPNIPPQPSAAPFNGIWPPIPNPGVFGAQQPHPPVVVVAAAAPALAAPPAFAVPPPNPHLGLWVPQQPPAPPPIFVAPPAPPAVAALQGFQTAGPGAPNVPPDHNPYRFPWPPGVEGIGRQCRHCPTKPDYYYKGCQTLRYDGRSHACWFPGCPVPPQHCEREFWARRLPNGHWVQHHGIVDIGRRDRNPNPPPGVLTGGAHGHLVRLV